MTLPKKISASWEFFFDLARHNGHLRCFNDFRLGSFLYTLPGCWLVILPGLWTIFGWGNFNLSLHVIGILYSPTNGGKCRHWWFFRGTARIQATWKYHPTVRITPHWMSAMEFGHFGKGPTNPRNWGLTIAANYLLGWYSKYLMKSRGWFCQADRITTTPARQPERPF